ncbi:MAG: hypothetical protein A2864_02680 [Candidatus Woykebacteria bacterium RIFCSPHIGHO2_01_FULL_39_12]|uniref:Uncharacterized protein n=2 Tax=Candidatus Woykeibacteriota TaxID=1817899 RepID=A0A1G1WD07_9BACT|nr:MAG: hypothetical protein A2134_03330 [Candidatus Woykebacteria bacterium RBG_16_39_9b]OGY27859.1 MAG: hypothetical protein A2864_02680 [Candidatus Woykebacteria bacterium RIFCSPHIGHO2_01_FULL_39_12]
MEKYFLKHSVQYALLALVFVGVITLLILLKNTNIRLILISFYSIFYFVFGVWHHWEEKKVKSTTVLEYLAISLIIFIILFAVFS